MNRARIGSPRAAYFRWVAAALGVAIMVWTLMVLDRAQLQNMPALKFLAVLLGALVLWGSRPPHDADAALIAALLMVFSLFIFPAAFKQSRTLADAADIHEFADWENAILHQHGAGRRRVMWARSFGSRWSGRII